MKPTCHGEVQLWCAVGFGHFFGNRDVLGVVGGHRPGLLPHVTHCVSGTLHWLAGSRTPLIAWICFHKGIFILLNTETQNTTQHKYYCEKKKKYKKLEININPSLSFPTQNHIPLLIVSLQLLNNSYWSLICLDLRY